MLYKINNGAVKFAAETILENINFEIRNTEKIAIVGRNGCGKTTLCRLIAGEVELSKRDSDEDIYIACAGKPSVGYLKQVSFPDLELTVEEELNKVYEPVNLQKKLVDTLEKELENDYSPKLLSQYGEAVELYKSMGGYENRQDMDIIFCRFGFALEDKKRTLAEFSGGQLTKIAFVKLLLCRPDIMILDEPTNHLDMKTIEWLEEYLKNYRSAVVIVSHDRMFLDRVCSVVYEIEYKTAIRYPGNYTDFMIQKRQNHDQQAKAYELQQKEIERLNTIVEKFKNKPTKVAMTRSKLKQIEHMDKIEAPKRYDRRSFRGNFKPLEQGGQDVLIMKQLSFGYTTSFGKLSGVIKKGQRLAVIGNNGAGKSTLIKTLVGEILPIFGEFYYGFQISYEYFDQQIALYNSNKTILEDFWDEFPTLTNHEVRSALGAFRFSGEEVDKVQSVLSGGEKIRLALAKMFQRRPNLLLLDEPTNHMDIVGKETLESVLEDYEGTVIFVSHDRYFVRKIADTLLIFEDAGPRFYDGGYDAYLEEQFGATQVLRDATQKGLGTALKHKEIKQEEPPIRQKTISQSKEEAKRLKQSEKLLDEIGKLEDKIRDYNEELDNPEIASDYETLNKLSILLSSTESVLELKLSEWENVNTDLIIESVAVEEKK